MDFDHRFIPLPAEANRVSLVDFEDQILEGVADGWDGQPIPGVNSDKLRIINSLSEERR
jgi:hypothetical protein